MQYAILAQKSQSNLNRIEELSLTAVLVGVGMGGGILRREKVFLYFYFS